MIDVKSWPTEAFAALLPLVMGGLVTYLFDGGDGLSAAHQWVGDGTLMPPATMLTVALLARALSRSSSQGTAWALMGLVLLLVLSVLLFAASVRPESERGLSAGHLFVWNIGLYLGVLALCVLAGVRGRRRFA